MNSSSSLEPVTEPILSKASTVRLLVIVLVEKTQVTGGCHKEGR